MFSKLSIAYNKLKDTDIVKPDQSGYYVYHTYFNEEFRAQSPDDVIQQLYENSNKEMNVSFDEWWQYQTNVMKAFDHMKVPPIDSPDANKILLSMMVKAQALIEGPLSKPDNQKPGGPS